MTDSKSEVTKYWGLDVLPRSYWAEAIDTDHNLTVIAGSDRATDTRGMLAVVTYSVGTPWQANIVGQFRAPAPAGPLRVVGATGERISLISAEGTALYFDVSVPGFVTADGELLPSVYLHHDS
jgi:hypothetical protein